MTQFKPFRLLLLFLPSLMFLSETFGDEQPILKIGVYERSFFHEKGPDGIWHGLDVDIVNGIFAKTQYTYEYVELPWKRTLLLMQSGDIDIALSAAPLPERKQYAIFSDTPFRLGHNALYVAKNNLTLFANINRLADIKNTNLRIGIMRGVSYSDEFEALKSEPWFQQHLITVDDPDRLPTMLLLRRVDGYLDSAYDGQRRVQSNPKAKSQISQYKLITSEEEATTYLMFSKHSMSEQAVQEINAAMRALVDSGEYQQLLAKYDLLDLQNNTYISK
ncbi:MAG: substrate-binding periplasmic protein [Aestuariibacter sp.]